MVGEMEMGFEGCAVLGMASPFAFILPFPPLLLGSASDDESHHDNAKPNHQHRRRDSPRGITDCHGSVQPVSASAASLISKTEICVCTLTCVSVSPHN